MRKTKLVTAVLVAGGLLLGASGTAMAVGNDSKPAAPAPTASTRAARPVAATPAPTSGTKRVTAAPAPVKRSATPRATVVPRDKVTEARAARPVPADPNFTG